MRDCRISNPGGAGVVVTSAVDSSIESCTLEHLGTSGVVIGEGGRVTVRGCTIRDARGNGVLANGEAQGSVEECDISSTDGPAIALEDRCTSQVLRTVVHDTSTGIHLTSQARTVLEDVRVMGTAGPGIVLGSGTDPLLRRCRTARTGGSDDGKNRVARAGATPGTVLGARCGTRALPAPSTRRRRPRRAPPSSPRPERHRTT